jgi:hypothetical protein
MRREKWTLGRKVEIEGGDILTVCPHLIYRNGVARMQLLGVPANRTLEDLIEEEGNPGTQEAIRLGEKIVDRLNSRRWFWWWKG